MNLKPKVRGNRIHMTGTILGERIRQTTGLKLGQMKAAKDVMALAEASLRMAKAAKSGVLVRDAWKVWGRRPDKPGVTSQTYVEAFVGQFGHLDLLEVDEAEVYETYLDGSGKAPGTLRRELGAIQSFLNWVARAKRVNRVFEIMKPGGAERRLRFLEEDEVRAMIAACPKWFLPSLLALFYMGVRRSELANAKWTDLRPQVVGGQIVSAELMVATRKGRDGKVRYRSVPMHPVVLAALPPIGKPTEPMFVNRDGRKFGDVTKINKAWARIAKAAGVTDTTPHDARRTFASMLLDKDVDLRTIADLLGHTSLSLLMLYAQVRGKRKAKSVEALPDLTLAGKVEPPKVAKPKRSKVEEVAPEPTGP